MSKTPQHLHDNSPSESCKGFLPIPKNSIPFDLQKSIAGCICFSPRMVSSMNLTPNSLSHFFIISKQWSFSVNVPFNHEESFVMVKSKSTIQYIPYLPSLNFFPYHISYSQILSTFIHLKIKLFFYKINSTQ